MTRRALTLVLALAVMVGACAASGPTGDESAGGPGASGLAGYERDPEPTVGAHSLPAVNRGDVDFAFRAEPDQLLLVYFGFTNCPDVCPTTLSDTKLAFAELGADRTSSLDLAMVTVDPARDDAESLSNYVEAFIDGGIALRTDDELMLREAAFAFGADYQITTDDEGKIEVGHTPNLYVVDDSGSLILTWPFGVTVDDLINDLTILLERQATAT